LKQADMPAVDLLRRCTDAIAILRLTNWAASAIQQEGDEGERNKLADDIQQATALAAELLEPVNDALETHEGVKGDRPRSATSPHSRL
jgi:hypothetical protein